MFNIPLSRLPDRWVLQMYNLIASSIIRFRRERERERKKERERERGGG
jgi:hypothetical protein